MAKLNKLVAYSYVKGETGIPNEIDDVELDHPIYRAQETLRMVIGDEFYQDFIAAYIADTMSAVYTSLYAYAKQFIAWQTYELYVIKANVKPTRSGFRVHSEENSTIASGELMAPILRDAKAQSQYYKKLMVDFLNNHATDYTLYDSGCNSNLIGNSFKISAVRNKHTKPDPFYGLV